MIKIRLEALPNEIDEYLEHLKSDSKVNVLEVSKEYPNRGNSKFVRVYASIELNVTQNKIRIPGCS